MIFDILKGIVLVIFTLLVFIIGWIVEALCLPLSSGLEKPLINNFISELWKKSFKY